MWACDRLDEGFGLSLCVDGDVQIIRVEKRVRVWVLRSETNFLSTSLLASAVAASKHVFSILVDDIVHLTTTWTTLLADLLRKEG